MKIIFKKSVILIGALVISSIVTGQTTEQNLHNGYSQSVWTSGHRDAENTDYVPVVMSRNNQIAKHLLQGHPLFWPPISGPNNQYYVSSGKGKGSSNFHAFDSDGNLLWQSKPQETLDDLDGWAIINAPAVAANGDIYVGDQNQLWAFKPDGSVKWVVDLTQYEVNGGFLSAVFSKGYVGGISSNGKVIFFHKHNGKLAMPVLDLPGGKGPPADKEAPEDLWKDLMDPNLKPIMFKLILGYEMEVANTPSVHPETGRLYITAAGIEKGTGLLYGIDVGDKQLSIAFKTSMGGGSGTSPAISHDGKQVYALDKYGHMIAIDAHTGRKIWTSDKEGGGAASPSIAPNETIYTLNRENMYVINYDGKLKFERNYNTFCEKKIAHPGWFAGLFLSTPVANLNSLLTIDSTNTGWVNIVCGYYIKMLKKEGDRSLVPIPNRSYIVQIDISNGDILGEPLLIKETSEGFIIPIANGNQFVTLSGAISSIYYHSMNRILPEYLQVPNEPVAGLIMLKPKSYLALIHANVEWLLQINQQLLHVPINNQNKLKTLLSSTTTALKTTLKVADQASKIQETSISNSTAIKTLVNKMLLKMQNTGQGTISRESILQDKKWLNDIKSKVQND